MNNRLTIKGIKLIKMIDEDEATMYWYAKNPQDNVIVVRILKPEFAKTSDVVEEFKAEIKSAIVNSNKNDSIEIFDDQIDGLPCTVMIFKNYSKFDKTEGNNLNEIDKIEGEINFLKSTHYRSEFLGINKTLKTSLFKVLLQNKKILLLFSIVTVLVIAITAIVTSSLTKKKTDNEYVAVINENLEFTLATLYEKSMNIYNTIDAKSFEYPGKYNLLLEKVRKIEDETNKFLEFIILMKEDIISECGGFDHNYSFSMLDKNNFGAAKQIVKTSDELDEMLTEYRALLFGFISDTSLIENKMINWNLNYLNSLINYDERINSKLLYEGMPSIATINLLTQLQIKIRLVEIESLQFLLEETERMDFRINKLSAFVSSPKTVLRPGEFYEAKIGMEAIDTMMRPIVYITYSKPYYDSVLMNDYCYYKLMSGQKYDTVSMDLESNRILKLKCTTPGKYNYGGLILFRSNLGDVWLPYSGSYTVL
ncbi:MAG: hypothetical protein PHW83_06925 [Bacteroidales bacterium]|nr:hypothetical protein [Bacteroidales bacterium]